MATDGAPKTAYEIAMERLRRQDREAGVDERPLTDAQRAAIAEARQRASARVAELEILHTSRLASVWDPGARAQIDQEHRRDVERVHADRDRRIAGIRDGRS